MARAGSGGVRNNLIFCREKAEKAINRERAEEGRRKGATARTAVHFRMIISWVWLPSLPPRLPPGHSDVAAEIATWATHQLRQTSLGIVLILL